MILPLPTSKCSASYGVNSGGGSSVLSGYNPGSRGWERSMRRWLFSVSMSENGGGGSVDVEGIGISRGCLEALLAESDSTRSIVVMKQRQGVAGNDQAVQAQPK